MNNGITLEFQITYETVYIVYILFTVYLNQEMYETYYIPYS